MSDCLCRYLPMLPAAIDTSILHHLVVGQLNRALLVAGS